MSRVLSVRIPESQMAQLQRLARRMGRTPSETGAMFIDEALRRASFAMIDFRDSAAGRQACIQGSTLAVWEVVSIARCYDMDVAQTAEHLGWPEVRVKAALNYAEAYPQEIDDAISDNDSWDFAAISRLLPNAIEFKSG